MKRIGAIVLVGFLSLAGSAAAQAPYSVSNVETVQKALIRLGYNPGVVDGQWGGNTRRAANELRQANNLPAARDLSGSTLDLVHRLSPGEMTLPNRGRVFTDVLTRREFLKANPEVAAENCFARYRPRTPLGQYAEQPVKRIAPTSGRAGYIPDEKDWYSPILRQLITHQGECLAGLNGSCRAIGDFLANWAAADALRPGARRSQVAFEDISWQGNVLLSGMINSYAIARPFLDDYAAEAEVIDWFKRRIDDYHFLRHTPGTMPGDINYIEQSNHAMAHMLPSVLFGALIGDRAILEAGLPTWRVALESMREDGSLPSETRRGARSLHYTNLQIGQLLAMADVAAGQEIDLYATASPDRSIARAVGFLLDALEDFDRVAGYASANHGGGASSDYAIPTLRIEMDHGWIPGYYARFGEDANIARMRSLNIDKQICSERSLSENKLLTPRLCTLASESGLPYAQALLEIGAANKPNAGIGYATGCLQSRVAWPLDLSHRPATDRMTALQERAKREEERQEAAANVAAIIDDAAYALIDTQIGYSHPASKYPNWVDSHFSFALKRRSDGKRIKPNVDFAIRGNIAQGALMRNFEIVLNRPLSDAATSAVSRCGTGVKVVTYGDERERVAMRFLRMTNNRFAFQRHACVVEAMDDAATAFSAGFVVDHFDELARSLVATGQIDRIERAQLRDWLVTVANGETGIDAVE